MIMMQLGVMVVMVQLGGMVVMVEWEEPRGLIEIRKKFFEKRFHLLSPRLQPVMKTDWGAMMNGNQTF